MNLLDENIRQDQGEQLRKWRLKFRRVTHELTDPGVQDSDIIPLLHRTKRPTFFTHDRDYFKASLVHPSYCLVWLDVFDGERHRLRCQSGGRTRRPAAAARGQQQRGEGRASAHRGPPRPA